MGGQVSCDFNLTEMEVYKTKNQDAWNLMGIVDMFYNIISFLALNISVDVEI